MANLICHVTFATPHDQEILGFYRRNLFILKNHLDKFGSHSHCGSGDVTQLICYVNLQNHVIKGCSGVMEGSSSLNVTNLAGLVAINTMAAEIMFLIYHVPSRDYVFKGLYNFVGGSSSQ